MTQLSESLRTQQEYLTDLRREFHEHPEIGLQEFWTADRIEKELDQFGVAHVRVGSTGVLGTIEGSGHGGGSIALRADIDGLPVQEINSVSYRSQNDGVMHAWTRLTHSQPPRRGEGVVRGAFGFWWHCEAHLPA